MLTSGQAETPPVDRFAAIMGDCVGRLGHVTVTGGKGCRNGVIYETTTGTFFLPYQQVMATRFVEETSGSTLWSVAAAIWAPLMFVLPFVRKRELREKLVLAHEPQRLTPQDCDRFPELLATTPGAFFLPLRQMQGIRQKRRRWQFIMQGGTVVSVEPVAGDAFAQKMQDLFQNERWRTLLDM